MQIYLILCIIYVAFQVELVDKKQVQQCAYVSSAPAVAWFGAVIYFLTYLSLAPLLFFRDCVIAYNNILDKRDVLRKRKLH